MQSILSDLRYAFRQMRQAPAFATVVVLLVAIGISANAVIFTLVDTLLLRKLPVRNPDELVRIIERHPPLPDSSYFDFDYWRLLREQSTSYSEVTGQADDEVSMTEDGTSEFVQLALAAWFALPGALYGWLRELLFVVAPSDTASIAAALVLIALIAIVALLLPAWRAVSLDPAVALREE